MADRVTIKCPSCGGNLMFDPASQRMTCAHCGSSFLQEELALQQAEGPEESTYRGYHCVNCGAEVVTTDTTAATSCYYCHSPIVLEDRLSGEFRPDGLLPFRQTREEALEQFQRYLKKKWFVDRRFFEGAQLEHLAGVYYPAWYGDFTGEVSFEGTGTKTSSRVSGQYVVTTTRHYQIHRHGLLTGRNVFRKALQSGNRALLDGIQPFPLEELAPYQPGYLSGFLAEMRDVPQEDAQADISQEVAEYGKQQVQEVPGLVTRGAAQYRPRSAKLRYVLLPAWILTYRGAGNRSYYYMMNGQTGKTCGRLPIRWGRLVAVALLIGAGVAGLFCGGGAWLW